MKRLSITPLYLYTDYTIKKGNYIMSNLGEGIEERAIEKVILKMYKEGCDLKFIANMTEKDTS